MFLNETEFICLHTVKWFHVLLSDITSFIFPQLNGFKYCYLTLVILFNIIHSIAHS